MMMLFFVFNEGLLHFFLVRWRCFISRLFHQYPRKTLLEAFTVYGQNIVLYSITEFKLSRFHIRSEGHHSSLSVLLTIKMLMLRCGGGGGAQFYLHCLIRQLGLQLEESAVAEQLIQNFSPILRYFLLFQLYCKIVSKKGVSVDLCGLKSKMDSPQYTLIICKSSIFQLASQRNSIFSTCIKEEYYILQATIA